MKSRNLLISLFAVLLLAMLALDLNALVQQDFFDAAVQLWPNPWVKAAGFDAIFALATIYVWIFSRERTPAARLFWLVFIAVTGSIATSSYILVQLFKLPPDAGIRAILARQAD